MCHGHRDAAAGHAGEKDRRAVEHFDQTEPRLELLALVARELRPRGGTRDDRRERRHHLAAVAHTERDGVGTAEETRELLGQQGVEHHRARPAFARAERVAVAETSTGDEALELVEPRAAGLQVAHVHIEGLEAGAVERVAGLEVAVDALLPQDRQLRPALADERCGQRRHGNGTCIEAELDMQARVVDTAGVFVLGVSASGVVAQFGDSPADLVPGLVQVAQRCAEHRLRIAPHLDHAAIVGLADEVAVLAQAMRPQRLHHFVAHGGRHLDHDTELFVEQRAQGQLMAARADLRGPVLRVAIVGTAVGDAVAFGDEHVDVQAQAHVAGKSHFAGRCPEPAVAAVVVREEAALLAQLVDRHDERLQLRGVVEVGHRGAELIQHLRQHRARHALLAVAEVDQDQRGVAGLELWRQRRSHVVERRERGDDEADRGGHLLCLAAVGPARAHRQRILADRHADAERGAQCHADRDDGVVERRVFARLAARGHPVAAQLDLGQLDRCGQQVRDRLTDRHAAGGRRVQRRQRRALADRHRLAAKTAEIGQRDRAIGHRHLPRPDHRIAAAQPADRAVTDRDQETLARDSRVPKHVERDLFERHVVQVELGRFAHDAPHVAQHLRRLAEQRVHRHRDRALAAGAVFEDELLLGRRHADHRERAALALGHRAEDRQRLGCDRHHVALLALVAPDLFWREAGFFEGHRAQVEARAHAGAVDEFGKRVRDSASAHVVDREDRVALTERPAVVDDLLRAALDLGVAALYRIEVERRRIGAGRHRTRSAPAHADSHARAAELDQQAAGRKRDFLRL